jgi:hypothetical protein
VPETVLLFESKLNEVSGQAFYPVLERNMLTRFVANLIPLRTLHGDIILSQPSQEHYNHFIKFEMSKTGQFLDSALGRILGFSAATDISIIDPIVSPKGILDPNLIRRYFTESTTRVHLILAKSDGIMKALGESPAPFAGLRCVWIDGQAHLFISSEMEIGSIGHHDTASKRDLVFVSVHLFGCVLQVFMRMLARYFQSLISGMKFTVTTQMQLSLQL